MALIFLVLLHFFLFLFYFTEFYFIVIFGRGVAGQAVVCSRDTAYCFSLCLSVSASLSFSTCQAAAQNVGYRLLGAFAFARFFPLPITSSATYCGGALYFCESDTTRTCHTTRATGFLFSFHFFF